MTTFILEHLKRATRANHDQLEQHPLLQRLRDPQLTSAEYGAILRVFYGFYAPLETKLGCMAEWNHLGFAFDERRKSKLLQQDLRTLNQPLFASSRHRPTLPRLINFASAVGCVYVLEGATLGGQIIARELQRHLGLHPMRGTAFFSGYGPATGPMWCAFSQFITRYAASLPSDRAIITGANATFHAFECWLNTAALYVSQE